MAMKNDDTVNTGRPEALVTARLFGNLHSRSSSRRSVVVLWCCGVVVSVVVHVTSSLEGLGNP